ncbi:MAG: D-glycerate dehydrogenase [Chloroflexota bacterium]
MSEQPNIYITRRLPQPALDLLSSAAQITVWPGELPPPSVVLRKEMANVDGLIVLPSDMVDAALLEAAPRLRVISNYAVECHNIDCVSATARGIVVTHTPDVLAETVADFTVALMLMAARRLIEAEQYVKAGRWRTWGPEILLGRDLHGTTLGLIGVDTVAQAVAHRAQSFGMDILYHNPIRITTDKQQTELEHVTLERLLSESDVISLHCPLTDETYHLIDSDALNIIKPDAILINTALGPIVDTRALVSALQQKPIIAALDVTDPEPLPLDHPLINLPNVIITPHMASASVQTRTRMALIAAENVLATLRGEQPFAMVNPEVWRERVISVGRP